MTSARYAQTPTRLADGRVLVAGGGNTPALASAEIYDPTTRVWTPTGTMATARAYHPATRLLDGRVLVADGGNTPALASAEIYDPASGTWTPTNHDRWAILAHGDPSARRPGAGDGGIRPRECSVGEH